MKIGFSLGKCVRDIVNGSVDINDVLVIVTRTRFEKPELLHGGLYSYSYERDYWMGLDYERCIEVCKELFETGKLHQPRLFNAVFNGPVSNDFVWMDLAPTRSEGSEQVMKAWGAYQLALKLSAENLPSKANAAEAVQPVWVGRPDEETNGRDWEIKDAGC